MKAKSTLALVFCGLVMGCSDAGSDKSPPARSAKVFYMRRDTTTGVFQPYVLSDPKAIDQLRAAIHDATTRGPILRSDWHMGISVMHALLFYDSRNTIVFQCHILGDDYLVVDGKRYSAEATLSCLKDLTQTKFQIATDDAIKGFSEVGRYVRRPRTKPGADEKP